MTCRPRDDIVYMKLICYSIHVVPESADGQNEMVFHTVQRYGAVTEAEGERTMAMHSNWNPWHGCIRCSEGCQNCYVYYMDSLRGKNGSDICKTKTEFRYPLSKDRKNRYKIQSGERISVCMTSDFFLEEADGWRTEAWDIMRARSDVIFLLLTKRPERVKNCLPPDWEAGWENIILNVSCENQRRADERIPQLLELPFRHKGLYCAPLLGPVSIGRYLDSGQIEQVACGGENCGGERPCRYEWVASLREECVSRDITFCFMETGTVFIRDGKEYRISSKQIQNAQAFRSGMSYQGRAPHFELKDSFGLPIPAEELYAPHFTGKCMECSFRILCNGCSDCGACGR